MMHACRSGNPSTGCGHTVGTASPGQGGRSRGAPGRDGRGLLRGFGLTVAMVAAAGAGVAVTAGVAGCAGDIVDPRADNGEPDPGPGGVDGGSADGPVGAGEPAALAGITQRHNDVRAAVGVAPLVWDPALAQVAQQWADQCVDAQAPAGLIDHNDGRSDDYPGYVGENIYGSSGAATAAGAVDAWASEGADYDYGANACAAGQVCGHYTQVVWAASERLGCGISRCPGLTFGNGIVCDYSPGGNTGGRPY